MTDVRLDPTPPRLRRLLSDIKKALAADTEGYDKGGDGYNRNNRLINRIDAIAEPIDLNALAKECTNAIAGCEPTDWNENREAIRAVLEKHL
jgi:hypothetical protein